MGKFSQFKIALAGLPQGTHGYDFHLDKQFFANMENTDIHDASLDVHLEVNHVRDVYEFAFHIEGTVTQLCDRCLDDLVIPISTDYHVTVKYGEDYDDATDDLLVIPYGDSSLNVAYMIYDTVVLVIPMRHVHAPGQCNRAMTAVLKRHRSTVHQEDAALEEKLIEEMDSMDAPAEQHEEEPDSPADDRWEALRRLMNDDN